MEKPDTISVVVTHREEIKADKVDIHVTIKGSSLVTGNAALKKAKEVNLLVNALSEVGIKEEDMRRRALWRRDSGSICSASMSFVKSGSTQSNLSVLTLAKFVQVV